MVIVSKKIRTTLLIILSAVLVTGCAVFGLSFLSFGGSVQTASAAADFSAAWNEAVAASSTASPGTLTLTDDWVATANSTAGFGTGTGFNNGRLCVPSGKSMILDLNGHTLNRNRTTSAAYGGVIYVAGTLVIQDTSSGGAGQVTGGYTTGDGGGVYVTIGGSFTLKSGSIYNCKATSHGGGICNYGGTVTISGGKIYGNTAKSNGGGVYNTNSSTVTMTSGSIYSNTASYGGGICNTSSSTSALKLSGGTIGGSTTTGNTASYYGGGIYTNTGTVALSGVAVTYNKCSAASSTTSSTPMYGGGGVFISGTSTTVNLSAGSVNYNTSATVGAGVRMDYGTLNISGSATISNNTVTYSSNSTASVYSGGGGLFMSAGTVSMTGGSINSNTASACNGGGVYMANGTFTMNGSAATISSNKIITGVATSYTAYRRGGGVYMTGGTFNLTSGAISSNTSSYYGGGVELYATTAALKISGGSISSNSANVGGGVYVFSGKVTMTAGSVTGNRTTNTSSYGGGIYLTVGTSMTMSGSAAVYDNYIGSTGTTASNVYTGGYPSINIAGALTSTHKTGLDGAGVFTLGYGTYNSTTAPSTYFTSDDGYDMSLFSGTGEVFVGTLMADEKPTWTDGTSETKTYTYDGTAHSNTYNAVVNTSVSFSSGSTKAGATLNTTTRTLSVTNVNVSSVNQSSSTTVSNYSISFTPSAGYCWADGAGYAKYLYVRIEPKKLTVTWSDLTKEYTGSTVVPTATVDTSGLKGSDTCGVKVTASSTDAGSRTAYAAPDNPNYTFGDRVSSASTAFYFYTSTSFTIEKATLTDTSTSYSGTYDGAAHGITVSASGFKSTDTLSTKGTIKYGTTSGSYTLTSKPTYTNVTSTTTIYYQVTFTNYNTITGSKTVTITARNLSTGTTFSSIANQVYSGSAKTPTVTVSNSGLATTSKTLTKDTDYTIAYSNNTAIGTATVTVTGKGNFTGTATTTFEIVKVTLTDASTAYSGTYDGAAHGITVNATGFVGSDTLASKGTIKYGTTSNSYTLTTKPTYSNVGTYTVYYQITFADTYNTLTGSKTVTISKATLTDASTAYSGTYDGAAHGITVNATGFKSTDTLAAKGTIKYGTTSSSYTLTSNPTYSAVGTHTVYYQITFDNYNTITGSKTVTITARNLSTGTTFSNIPDQKHTGSEITPVFTVSNSGLTTTSKTLTKDTDYTVAYTDNVDEGTATITITGKGNFTGTATTTFEIVKTALTDETADVSVTYDGEEHGITVTVTGFNEGDSLAAVGTVKYGTEDGVYELAASPVYSESGTYTVYYQVTFTGGYNTLTGSATVTISKETLTDTTTGYNGAYDGAAHGITVSATGFIEGDSLSDGTIKYGTEEGEYELDTCPTQTNAGTLTVYYEVTFDNYETVTGSVTITVTQRDISNVTVTVTGEYEENGTEIIPTFTVTDGDIAITEDDYTVSYSDNVNAGTATITLTGAGNYTGTKTQTFEITSATQPDDPDNPNNPDDPNNPDNPVKPGDKEPSKGLSTVSIVVIVVVGVVVVGALAASLAVLFKKRKD